MTSRALIHLTSAALLAALVGSCGDPFSQPACYFGPGCGEDKVPPVGVIISPVGNGTVSGNFWLEVSATDNIAVLGVDFFLMDIQINDRIVTKPPYRFLVDPTFVRPVPGITPGSRELTVMVRDVAQNVDTLYLTVNYQP